MDKRLAELAIEAAKVLQDFWVLRGDLPKSWRGTLTDDLVREAAAALRAEPAQAGEAMATIIASMRNFADVADRDDLTVTNAPAAIRTWADMLEQARPAPTADKAAALRATTGEGEWVMVPREPTEAMLRAGVDAAINAAPNRWCPPAYRAMLAAAPAPNKEANRG